MGADAQFGALREVEITLSKSYAKDLPPKLNRFGIPEKRHYRTGDLCPLLNVGPDALRWRFRTGKYPNVTRDGKGRLFTPTDIERILDITRKLPNFRTPNCGEIQQSGLHSSSVRTSHS